MPILSKVSVSLSWCPGILTETISPWLGTKICNYLEYSCNLCANTHRQVSEHCKGATEESDEVTQVVTGLSASLCCRPIIISQLQKLVNLLIQVSVDLLFSSMPRILYKEKQRMAKRIQTRHNMCVNNSK